MGNGNWIEAAKGICCAAPLIDQGQSLFQMRRKFRKEIPGARNGKSGRLTGWMTGTELPCRSGGGHGSGISALNVALGRPAGNLAVGKRHSCG